MSGLDRAPLLDLEQHGKDVPRIDLAHAKRTERFEDIPIETVLDVGGVDGFPPRLLLAVPFPCKFFERIGRSNAAGQNCALCLGCWIPVFAQRLTQLLAERSGALQFQLRIGAKHHTLFLRAKAAFKAPLFVGLDRSERVKTATYAHDIGYKASNSAFKLLICEY